MKLEGRLYRLVGDRGWKLVATFARVEFTHFAETTFEFDTLSIGREDYWAFKSLHTAGKLLTFRIRLKGEEDYHLRGMIEELGRFRHRKGAHKYTLSGMKIWSNEHGIKV